MCNHYTSLPKTVAFDTNLVKTFHIGFCRLPIFVFDVKRFHKQALLLEDNLLK
jgi:hypothetical protein